MMIRYLVLGMAETGDFPKLEDKGNEILPIFTVQCYVEPSGDLYWIKFV